MTKESLLLGIQRLVLKRRTATREEQERINAKLSKLYDLQWVMNCQEVE